MTSGNQQRRERHSLAELRNAYPGDSTLENLLDLLRAELDLCARLPLCVYEATAEGHYACASMLRELTDAQRAHVELVLASLQQHLEQRTPPAEMRR